MNVRDFLVANKNKLIRLFLYALFGVLGTVINILIFAFLTEKCGVYYMVSNVIAWLFSIIFAFLTNKNWVFESNSWKISVVLKESVQFTVARIGTCVFDMGYMFVAVSILDSDKTISKIIANALVVILNYILSKVWIFKR